MFGTPADDSSRTRRPPGAPPAGAPHAGMVAAAGAPVPGSVPPARPVGPPEQSHQTRRSRRGGEAGGQRRDGERTGTPADDQGDSHTERTSHGFRVGRPTQRRPAEPVEDGSDAPEVPEVPVRRLLSLAVAGFSALLALGLVMGAQTAGIGAGRTTYGAVILGAQVLYVFATTVAIRPPGALVVGAVGLLTAAAADITAVFAGSPSLGPLGQIAAGAVVVGVLGQLVRREGRMRVTESLGASMVIVLGVVSLSTLILLTRVPVGTQAIVVCLVATGTALFIARLADVVAPWPRLAAQVPRGSIGVVLGAMVATGVAGVLGKYIVGFTPGRAALAGAIAAGAAVLADLTVGFAEAGRELEGDAPTMWLARHMQGPLAAFALAAPVTYLVSVLYLVPS